MSKLVSDLEGGLAIGVIMGVLLGFAVCHSMQMLGWI